ncbi:hypothetical protein DYQ86_13665 [Acidobacteria bacterium AB60]|nr:hypothetical protein DYQ86_13665 [Acidobacteria bacterium AB60]
MQRFTILWLGVLLACSAAGAQRLVAPGDEVGGAPSVATAPAHSKELTPMPAFSRMALGAGLSINGIDLQAATNINAYTNLRVTGNVFSHTVTGISTDGFSADGSLSLATLGAAVDYFPWPRHGFRVSPGLLLYNDNSLSAHATVSGNESFTLNHVDYYSSPTNPVRATARLGLGSQNPAFTLTTGWGNMISRTGGHWSFPVEIGAAFVGTPSVKMTLSGTACDVTRVHCVNAATDSNIQGNLQAQIAKYRSDLDPLKAFPIFSFGVSYSFSTGRDGR